MPVGLQKSYSYARPKVGHIISGELFKNKDERIVDIRQTIKLNEYLIHYYQDLTNSDSLCSFEVYKAELDKQAAELQKRYDFLQRQYNQATNGSILSLHKANEELAAKLKELKATISKTPKRIHKVKDLRERIIQLEQELYKATQTDIESLLEEL